MNRRTIGILLLPGFLFLLLIASMNVVQAAPAFQEVTAEPTAEATPAEPLPQPYHVTVRQQLPISVDLSQAGIPTETLPLLESFALTLDLTIEFMITNTLTSTTPSTVSLVFADDLLNSLPISLTLDGVTETVVVLMPQLAVSETATVTATITETPTLTATEALTVEEKVTPTVGATPEITTTPEITVTPAVTPGTEVEAVAPTANVTANLRSGPGTTFDLVGTAPLNSELEIAGITQDGTWYLLADGSWIFGDLVNDPPSTVPIATQALIEQVAADAAAAAEQAAAEEAAAAEDDEGTETPDDGLAPEAAATPEPDEEGPDEEATEAEPPVLAPTPTPAPAPVGPTATLDANLRAGPGTQYEIVGGTITGQALDIAGQNAGGDWFLLSNGGWIADFLVQNPPDDAPVVPDDASPLLTGEETAPVLVPTPIPGQAAAAAEAEDEEAGVISLGLAENLYLDEVRTLISRYELAGEAVEQLAGTAGDEPALFEDADWAADMGTAVATLQRSGQQIRALEPPPLFAAAHIDMRSAAAAFDEAVSLLELGLTEASTAQLQEAITQMEAGATQLQAAQEKISAVAQ